VTVIVTAPTYDAISIGGHKGDVDVLGLAAQVHIAGADADIAV
jgi:hypothetical protein